MQIVKTTPALTLATLCALLLAGCRTTRIGTITPIPIPAALTARDAQAAIVQTTLAKPPAIPEGSNWEKIVDSVLSARMPDYRSQFNKKGTRWFVEDISPDAVVLGYQRGNYYLRVRMNISSGQIRPTIEGSQNLDQHGDKIHENALVWVDTLCVDIRATLGRYVLMKQSSETRP
jgi:hypothetical protein